MRAQSLDPLGPKSCSCPRLCPACHYCGHLREHWTCSLEAKAVASVPVEEIRHQLRGNQGMPAALPSLWGSPAHCLLREPLSRPVLPPGRRLPGPGAEGSQENSGGDPGEGQHRGECAGADGCCSCCPHVARGSAAPAEQKGANASPLAAGLSVQSGERLPAPQTRVRGPRYAARPAPCRASSLPWRCSHRTPPVLGGRGHSPAPRPVTDDAHGGRATSEARCPARGSQPCWRGLAPRLTLRGPGAPGGVGLSAGRWGESR